jgi:hypothetical protein
LGLAWFGHERLHLRNGASEGCLYASPDTPRVDELEERVLAFAEQLGRIAGTMQVKTAGWMDGDALKKDLARVRDGAADLLQQLTADAPPVAVSRPTARPTPRTSGGRSGGIVDARGEETSPAHADRSRRKPCGQSGGQNARGENDGEDIPTPRPRLKQTDYAGTVSVTGDRGRSTVNTHPVPGRFRA